MRRPVAPVRPVRSPPNRAFLPQLSPAVRNIDTSSRNSRDNTGLSQSSSNVLRMERYFMTRTSAVALLVGTRRALRDELQDKPAHETSRTERMIQNLERMLLDVRAGRTSEFDLEYPSRVHVIVSD
jgi:hypothetical protein